jgi:hypothetical protein
MIILIGKRAEERKTKNTMAVINNFFIKLILVKGQYLN